MKKTAITKACQQCGKTYQCKLSRALTSKFCSTVCKAESLRFLPKNDPRLCAICGKVFTPSRKMGHARFCSKPCIWKATKGPEFNARISRETVAARANKMRRTGKLAHTYVKRGGRHEHRVVAEEKLGRPLERHEIVHHIDGDPKNNDPDNLMVITQGEHMREHGLGIPGVTPAHKPWLYRKSKKAAT